MMASMIRVPTGIYLTVVITAYNRREYIKEAVDSVLDQTLKRDNYEVIVTKNYYDDDLEQFLKQQNVVSIIVEGHIGSQVVKAAKSAQGDVIVLLEDDDLFEREKLEEVIKAFDFYSSLHYYHNEANYVSKTGNFINLKSPFFETRNNKILKGGELLDKVDFRAYRNLYSMSSCIAIRKSLILENASYLQTIRYGFDNVLFFLTLGPETIYFQDCKKLTKRRMSSQSASRMTDYSSMLAESLNSIVPGIGDQNLKRLVIYERDRVLALDMLSRRDIKVNERIQRCKFVKENWNFAIRDKRILPLLLISVVAPLFTINILKVLKFA